MSELVYENYRNYTGVKAFKIDVSYSIECKGFTVDGRIHSTKSYLEGVQLDLEWFGISYVERVADERLDNLDRAVTTVNLVYEGDAELLIDHLLKGEKFPFMGELTAKLMSGPMDVMVEMLGIENPDPFDAHRDINSQVRSLMNEIVSQNRKEGATQ